MDDDGEKPSSAALVLVVIVTSGHYSQQLQQSAPCSITISHLMITICLISFGTHFCDIVCERDR